MIMNLPIMSIVAASTPVAAVATTTTATAIVSRPVTTAAAIVPNDIFNLQHSFSLHYHYFEFISFKNYKKALVVKIFIKMLWVIKWTILGVYDVRTFPLF